LSVLTHYFFLLLLLLLHHHHLLLRLFFSSLQSSPSLCFFFFRLSLLHLERILSTVFFIYSFLFFSYCLRPVHVLLCGNLLALGGHELVEGLEDANLDSVLEDARDEANAARERALVGGRKGDVAVEAKAVAADVHAVGGHLHAASAAGKGEPGKSSVHAGLEAGLELVDASLEAAFDLEAEAVVALAGAASLGGDGLGEVEVAGDPLADAAGEDGEARGGGLGHDEKLVSESGEEEGGGGGGERRGR